MKAMYQLKQVPSEAQIRKFIRRIVFGKNLFCPECRSRNVLRYEERYRCLKCRRKFSLLSHTWLANTKLPLQTWWLILWCWVNEVPVKQSVKLTETSQTTVRHWFEAFRDHLPPDEHVLEHLIQLDEAFFKDMTLMMGKEVGTRKLAYAVIPGTHPQRHHAVQFLFEKVAPHSQLNTDGAGIYQGIEKWWPVDHHKDIHSRWEFELTSEIEGVFGNYRTFVRRMYHHHWSQNLSQYVREFSWRFSSPELFESPRNYLTKSLILVPTCY